MPETFDGILFVLSEPLPIIKLKAALILPLFLPWFKTSIASFIATLPKLSKFCASFFFIKSPIIGIDAAASSAILILPPRAWPGVRFTPLFIRSLAALETFGKITSPAFPKAALVNPVVAADFALSRASPSAEPAPYAAPSIPATLSAPLTPSLASPAPPAIAVGSDPAISKPNAVFGFSLANCFISFLISFTFSAYV